MPNLKKPLADHETQQLKFANIFVNWYYSDYNSQLYKESLDETLERFTNRNPLDLLELNDMHLSDYIVQQAILYDATAQDLTNWYWQNVESNEKGAIDINLKNWLLLKRQKPKIEILDKNMKPTGAIIEGSDFKFEDQKGGKFSKTIKNSTTVVIQTNLTRERKPPSALDELVKSYKTTIDTFTKAANELDQKFK